MQLAGLRACLVAACLLAQDKTSYDDLVAKTNALERFVAVYRVSRAGDAAKGSVRMEYLAPDNLKIELADGTLVCLHGGILDLRSKAAGAPPSYVHVPMAEIATERSHSLEAVVHTEFPALVGTWVADAGCGGQMQLNISGTPDKSREDVDLSLSYVCPRKALLGWLESLPAAGAGRALDGERTEFATPGGGSVTLSTRSGFVESVKRKGEQGEPAFRLESLDFEAKLGADAFAVPAPSIDAVDGSAEFNGRWQETMTSMWNRRFVGWLSARVSEKKLEWNADARVHARKALGSFYSEAIALESVPWMTATQDHIEKFGAWFSERTKASPDKGTRDQVEKAVRDARATLVETLGKMVENRVAGLSIAAEDVPDAEVRQSLLELEQGAFRDAFKRALQDPLLAAFDDRIERAKR